jgi:hypothetical protein
MRDLVELQKTIRMENVEVAKTFIVEGATVTIVPAGSPNDRSLCILLAFAGKQIVFSDHGDVPENGIQSSKIHVLHSSCHRKKIDIASCVRFFDPETIVFSGAVPEYIPENRIPVSVRACGAVAMTIHTNGISIKQFAEAGQDDDKP